MNLFLAVNDDDDNGDGVVDNEGASASSLDAEDDEMAALIVRQFAPSGLTGTLTMEIPSGLRLFSAAGVPVSTPVTVDLSAPTGPLAGILTGDVKFFIEATATSSNAAVVLRFTPSVGSPITDAVHMTLTTTDITGGYTRGSIEFAVVQKMDGRWCVGGTVSADYPLYVFMPVPTNLVGVSSAGMKYGLAGGVMTNGLLLNAAVFNDVADSFNVILAPINAMLAFLGLPTIPLYTEDIVANGLSAASLISAADLKAGKYFETGPITTPGLYNVDFLKDASAGKKFSSEKLTVLKVDFLDASKHETNSLQVGKWQNGFNAGPSVKDAFIDQDPDKFHVRVNDQSKKGSGKVSVKLSTDSAGTDYDDDATEIELTEEPANSGIFISTNMLMVSDDVDDDFTNSNVVADDTKNDRTHKIAMGGKVKVQYPETGTVICEKKVDVPVEKTVDIHVVVLKNGSTVLIGERFLDANDNGVWDSGETYRDTDGSGTYTTNLTEANAQARVEEEFKVFKERYAQVRIKCNVTIEFKQALTNINDGLIELSPSSPNGDANLSADEKALLQTGLNSADANDIEVYYVKQSKRGSNYTRGSSFPADWYRNMTTADLNDTFIIPNKANYYSSSHEAYHIFSQLTPHASELVNIFYGTTAIVLSSDAQVTDSRRWSPSQEPTMQTSAYAH